MHSIRYKYVLNIRLAVILLLTTAWVAVGRVLAKWSAGVALAASRACPRIDWAGHRPRVVVYGQGACEVSQCHPLNREFPTPHIHTLTHTEQHITHKKQQQQQQQYNVTRTDKHINKFHIKNNSGTNRDKITQHKTKTNVDNTGHT